MRNVKLCLMASPSSGAPLGLLPLAARLLQPNCREQALQLVEIMGKRHAIIEFEAADGLVVKLEDALAQVRPERKAFPRELDHARPLVLGIGHPLDKAVALETFQDAVEVLPADNE